MKNDYEIKGDVAIVFAIFKGEKKPFYFDKDVFLKMKEKNVTYSVNTDGYLYWVDKTENNKRKIYTVHRYLVFQDILKGKVIDHINHKRNDNRKINLRIIDKKMNTSLKFINEENQGKYYNKLKDYDNWYVRKSYNGKQIHFGYFKSEKDAKDFVEIIKKIWG